MRTGGSDETVYVCSWGGRGKQRQTPRLRRLGAMSVTSPNPVDLVVRSQKVMLDSGPTPASIAVSGERIDGLFAYDEPLSAAQDFDVGDNPVIPGLIDTHAHFRDPGYTHKEDFESGTRAAAAGGVTTVFDMPNVDPPTSDAGRLKAHLANAASKALIDFGHNASGVFPERISELDAGGATAFKVWMMTDIGREYPHPAGTAVSDHAILYRIFEEVAATGRPLYVHPHDQALYGLFVERARAEWGTDFRSYARALRSGDNVVLDTAIAILLQLQRATGARLHILHLSSREGIRMVAEAKAEGRPITAEANPFALFVTSDWKKIEARGPFSLGFWVPEQDVEPMWSAVVEGTIDVLGSDHGPHTKAEKEVGWTDMYSAPGGSPFIEHYLRLLLTEVNRGRLSLQRVVELTSSAPAKLTGLHPQKGAIAVGSDADLVVLDMDHEEVLRAENSHYRCGWMPAEGLESQGKPTMTFLRGRLIMKDGEVLAEPGYGRHQVGAPVAEESRVSV
jgi:dihydroorotase